KLLLANPALDRQRYGELFQLNEAELELVTNLIPRQQFLLKRPDVTKVLSLNVDPKSYWIYTNTPLDNDRVAAIVQKYGFDAGMDRLAASGGMGGIGISITKVIPIGLLLVASGVYAPATSNAQTPGVREVTASPRTLIQLQTRLRYTTMIVLPEGEEILDVVCGDKDFWVV